MPLEILGPLVIAGIAFVVVLVRLTVNHQPRLLTNSAMAQKRFLMDYPKADFDGNWLISDDREVAMSRLAEPPNALALVEVMGSKHLTRLLTARDLKSVSEQGDDLMIELDDFTLPAIRVKMQEFEIRETARQLCQSILTVQPEQQD